MTGMKRWLAIGWICIVMVVVAACSSASGVPADSASEPAPETNGQPAQQVETTPQIPKEPVEIVFYSVAGSGGSEEGFFNKWGNPLRQKFPHYKITSQPVLKGVTLQDIVTSGMQIDIGYNSIGNYENAITAVGMEVDMTDLVKRHNLDLGVFEPTLVDAIVQSSGGKLYGVPMDMNTMVLFYNKAIFDKFGVPYPKDDMTWDEVNALAKRITRVDNGVQYYGYSGSLHHIIRMNQLSLPTIDMATEKPTLGTDQRWRRLFETTILNPVADYADLFRAGTLKTFPWADVEFLKNQTLAMHANQFIVGNRMAQFAAMDWDIVSYPVFADMPKVGPQLYPSYFGIMKTSRHPEEAMEVLKFMVSDDYQKELGRKGALTVLKSQEVKDVFVKESGLEKYNLQAIFRNSPAPIPPKMPYDAQMVDIYYSAVRDEMLIRGSDMNTAWRKAEEAAEKKIAEFNAANK